MSKPSIPDARQPRRVSKSKITERLDNLLPENVSILNPSLMESSFQTDADASIGGWPQRLLHVPTMTSYEWQAGHKYGVHIQPRYNAISYTWGRYQLNLSLEKPYIKPIKIEGVDWEIPRIDDSHFTVDQFEGLVRRSIEPSSYSGQNPAFTPSSIEFVWLDIACINQTPNHPQMAVEIGRQARIFRKAKRVLIWLNQATSQGLERKIADIVAAAANAEQRLIEIPLSDNRWTSIPASGSKMFLLRKQQWLTSKIKETRAKIKDNWFGIMANTPRTLLQGDEQWLVSALENVSLLTEDRWFSSLWTLQEAFLCQWAYMISGEVEALQVSSPQLKDIFTACETLNAVCKRSIAYKRALNIPTADTEVRLVDMIEGSGLAALAMENPMALYTVASNRVTSRPTDRIYGIMQVFDLQLGISAPHADKETSPDLLELELQLGQELLSKYPIMSQLHVHTQPVKMDQAWRVSSSSRVPELASKVGYLVTRSLMGDHTVLCQFSSTVVDGNSCASFSGKMCSFKFLQQVWSSMDRRRISGRRNGKKSTQQIIVDSSALMPPSLFTDDPTQDIPRDERQHRLAAELVNLGSRQGLSISVLLLGRFSDDQHTEDWWKLSGGSVSEFTGDRFNIGLIMVRNKNAEVWNRLGICIWDLVQTASGQNAAIQRDVLDGNSNDWTLLQGNFR